MQEDQGPAEIMPATIPDPIPIASPITMPASTHSSDDASDDDDLRFFRAQLNPSELALLDLLLRETLAGRAADIHAINKILGVSSKEASLQKARRSLSINHINSCFRQTFKMDATLIIRERDLEDKRAFVYKLDPRYAESIGRNSSST